MHKWKNKLVIAFLAIIALVSTYSLIFASDQKKKLEKYQALQSQYASQYASLEAYQKDYHTQILALKNENLQKMLQAQKDYELLLTQQPTLIAQNTSTTVQTSTNTNTNSSSTSATKTVKVTKPKSAPVTSAS